MKTKNIIIIITILSTIILSIWLTTSINSNYKHIKDLELKNAFVLNSSPTFEGYFYKGTSDDFHLFVSKWKHTKDNYFKISEDDFTLSQPFVMSNTELRIYVNQLDTSSEFGKNAYCKLYFMDNKKKLKQISLFTYKAIEKDGEIIRGDRIASYEEDYYIAYNEKGNIVEEIWFKGIDSIDFKIEYIYDKKENLIKQVGRDSKMRITNQSVKKYDDSNRLIETNSSYSELSDFKETHHNKTINKYNDNGNLTEKIYFENGNLTQSFQYNYIDNNMVEQFQYNSNKEILFHTIKKYNSQNQIIKHLTNLGKEDSSTIDYTYNENNLLIKKQSSSNCNNSIHSFKYKNGILIEEVFQGLVLDKVEDYNKTIYKRNKYGKLLETIILDKENKILTKNTYKYNAENNCIEENYHSIYNDTSTKIINKYNEFNDIIELIEFENNIPIRIKYYETYYFD